MLLPQARVGSTQQLLILVIRWLLGWYRLHFSKMRIAEDHEDRLDNPRMLVQNLARLPAKRGPAPVTHAA